MIGTGAIRFVGVGMERDGEGVVEETEGEPAPTRTGPESPIIFCFTPLKQTSIRNFGTMLWTSTLIGK